MRRGDPVREGPRILDFLHRAEELSLSPPAGCAQVREVLWLGDALAVVQEHVNGIDLAISVSSTPDAWRPPKSTLFFLKRLAEVVDGLHERGIAHGDLKPQNILVVGSDEPQPILVDLVDFSPAADGDIVTSAYAPPTGGRMERDRYAVTRIVEEVLARCELAAEVASSIVAAVAKCRTTVPQNGTLLPLLDAFEREWGANLGAQALAASRAAFACS